MESERIDGKWAWTQTYTSALITLGSVFGSAGFSVYLFLLSGGENIMVQLVEDFDVPLFITGGFGMMGIGATLISIGLIISRIKISKLFPTGQGRNR